MVRKSEKLRNRQTREIVWKPCYGLALCDRIRNEAIREQTGLDTNIGYRKIKRLMMQKDKRGTVAKKSVKVDNFNNFRVKKKEKTKNN